VDAGAEPMLHALAAGCQVDEGKIRALFVETKSGRGAVVAEQFIDASGDADLAHWAGIPTEKSEELAYPTLMFRLGRVDGARALAEGKPHLRAAMAEAEAKGEFHFPRRSAYINPQPHREEWRANVTQIACGERAADGTSASELSQGEIEGRRQVRSFARFLKERVAGFEEAYLLDIAPQLGIRETRRVQGKYRLTADDVLACRDFDDGIGLNAWPLEQHLRGDTAWTFLEGRGYGALPLRMLIPIRISNLTVAGRCASATHEAQASVRVSGPCFVMGQAAGTLAALRCGREDAVQASEVRASLAKGGALLDL